MKWHIGILAVLLVTLVACESVPERIEEVPEAPEQLVVHTAQGSYSGILTVTEGVYTWQLTEPASIAGLTFTCTDTGCTMAVADLQIPLDEKTAEHVRSAIATQRSSHVT